MSQRNTEGYDLWAGAIQRRCGGGDAGRGPPFNVVQGTVYREQITQLGTCASFKLPTVHLAILMLYHLTYKLYIRLATREQKNILTYIDR